MPPDYHRGPDPPEVRQVLGAPESPRDHAFQSLAIERCSDLS